MNQLLPISLSACLLAVAFTACSKNDSARTNAPAAAVNANVAATSNPNAQTGAPQSPLDGIVRANAARVEMRAGERRETSVRLSIADGYHVNANPATEKYLIPTSLEVEPEAGITVEKIAYPKPLTKKFSFSEIPLAVYEGDAEIKLTVSAPRDARAGQQTLRANLRVQPCDDKTCYPPTKLTTAVEITIR